MNIFIKNKNIKNNIWPDATFHYNGHEYKTFIIKKINEQNLKYFIKNKKCNENFGKIDGNLTQPYMEFKNKILFLIDNRICIYKLI